MPPRWPTLDARRGGGDGGESGGRTARARAGRRCRGRRGRAFGRDDGGPGRRGRRGAGDRGEARREDPGERRRALQSAPVRGGDRGLLDDGLASRAAERRVLVAAGRGARALRGAPGDRARGRGHRQGLPAQRFGARGGRRAAGGLPPRRGGSAPGMSRGGHPALGRRLRVAPRGRG